MEKQIIEPSHHSKRNNLRRIIINNYKFIYFILPLYFIALGIWGWYEYGAYIQLTVIQIPNIITYTSYPFSLIIFSSLGIFLIHKYSFKGIPLLSLGVFSWDSFGSLPNIVSGSNADNTHTPLSAWIFWGAIILISYIISDKPKINIKNYATIAILSYLWFGQYLIDLIQFPPPRIGGEPIFEILWCIAFIKSISDRKPM